MMSFLLAILLSQTPPVCEVVELKPPFELKVLPAGQLCALKDDTKASCYLTAEEVMKLVDADVEIRKLREEVALLTEKAEAQAKVIEQKDLVIKTYVANETILQTQVDRLDRNWKQALGTRTAINIAILTASTVGALTVGASIGVTGTLLVKSVVQK